jgi:flagellar motor switch/type III secretory pathway protein FliN
MATQFPSHPAASETAAVSAQGSAQARPSANPGAVQGAPAAHAGEPGSGTTNLVANGGLRPGDGLAGNNFELGADYEVLRLSAPLERLPVGLVVSVPVREFRIRNLLAMAPGALIETQWGHGEDLPLSSGDVQLAWSEFEVVDARLAVRVTRLS